MKSKTCLFIAVFTFVSVLASTVHAATLRVVVVKTDNVAAYAKEIEKGKAILKRLGGSGVVRVWQARIAGPDTGQVVVSLEYPDLATFVSENEKAMADREYRAWLSALSNIRTILSDSIYEEAKP